MRNATYIELVKLTYAVLKGVSDTPAWVVSQANQYAKDHGKTPFVIYQVAWSVLNRKLEHEVLPMCRHEGIAITAYGVLGFGHIRTDEEEERRLDQLEVEALKTGELDEVDHIDDDVLKGEDDPSTYEAGDSKGKRPAAK